MELQALGADGTPYITQQEATVVLRGLFNGVHDQMVAQSAETQGLIAQLSSDVQQAITAAQTGAEEQVEFLRGHTRTAVIELEANLASSAESLDLYEAARKQGEEEFMAKTGVCLTYVLIVLVRICQLFLTFYGVT